MMFSNSAILSMWANDDWQKSLLGHIKCRNKPFLITQGIEHTLCALHFGSVSVVFYNMSINDKPCIKTCVC